MVTTFSLDQLAAKLRAELHGDAGCLIFGLAPLELAQEGQLSFIEGSKYLKKLTATGASAVLLTADLLADCPTNALVVGKPRLAFAELLQLLYPVRPACAGIHPSSIIGQGCHIDPSVTIGPHVVIENGVSIAENSRIDAGCYLGEGVHIGAASHLYPRVTLYHDVKIGACTIIHSGAVIGADGFGFEKNEAKEWVKLRQVGSVLVGDDVEIGANTTIDRGAMLNTVIGNGVKLDNQIMVGHNVTIGDHTLIAGCTGIAGSTKIGRQCIIGGHVAINGHIELVDGVIITGTAMVTRSLLQPGVYSSGTGILPNKQWVKSAVRFKQLDDIHRRLQQLEREST